MLGTAAVPYWTFFSRTNILETFLAKRMKKLENRMKLKTWKGVKEGNTLCILELVNNLCINYI